MPLWTFSSFFVLTSRGDNLISRDFRGETPKSTPEVFFHKVKTWKGGEAPPVFHVDGTSFLFVRKSALYFVLTSKSNVSPSYGIELLTRLTKVFKDYCGVLSEESIRSNFVLVYELVDEILDYGYVQGTSTEALKAYIFNEPVAVDHKPAPSGFMNIISSQKTVPSSATNKPIQMSASAQKGSKNEIFVDLYERLTVLFGPNGNILRSDIDGSIQMKSYLAGNPELRMALNEDLIIGRKNSAYGVVVLDDCNFHECVRLDEFEADRTLALHPPDGEFVVMNYRIESGFRVPFKIFPFIEHSSTDPIRLEIVVKVRADIPETSYGNHVVVRVPVPKSTTSASCELMSGVVGQSTDYKAQDKMVTWVINKFMGETEQLLRIKIMLAQPATESIKKEVGPISMEFEIPMYNCSNLQIRFLRVVERNKQYFPYRWVRYITMSSSYVCRA